MEEKRWNGLTLKDRVELSTVKGDGCWEWSGVRNYGGYGMIKNLGRVMGAHRAAWLVWRGDIPFGLLVLHKCDNPGCVNPDHLFLGTAKDNVADCREKGRMAKRHKPHTRLRKLTDDQVRAIRMDDRPIHIVAYEFKVAEATIYNIRARRRKASVKDVVPENQVFT